VKTFIEEYLHLENAVNVALMLLMFYIATCDTKKKSIM